MLGNVVMIWYYDLHLSLRTVPTTLLLNIAEILLAGLGRHGCGRMVVGLTTTRAISTYHH